MDATLTVTLRAFEFSGSAMVEDGILVVEDELVGMVLFMPTFGSRQVESFLVKIERKGKESRPFKPAPKLFAIEDFEGLASDRDNDVYLIGSHQPDDGDRRIEREFLIHARWKENKKELTFLEANFELLKQMVSPLEEMNMTLGLTDSTIKADLNIEGLAFHEDKLFIGFREPKTDDGKALMLSAYAESLFENNSNVDFKITKLDLKEAGIRALDWDPQEKKMLILSGASKQDDGASPKLWSFDLGSRKLAEIYIFEDTDRIPEGVSRTQDGKIVVVFDLDTDQPAEIMLLNWRSGVR
ncbi:DUF3616 domain-containing protein [candidate division KSB1 bacterium]|nr:DUF3616 domain-containing protein [candidate division KSB1 bacterium]NIS26790.1 DUF3616 domain-containing protein [candidate division KSB1 bacterium]NIT73584.1 DUF3616 domain-containing protein [candidate division KSB1 bacterium]NIU27460.1 DUF3616 domain-containing protein [candidate division KSB1 bacterium]NIU90028.1 DUF3616 domain-containing protein [candidate division KSB1 bacterium]